MNRFIFFAGFKKHHFIHKYRRIRPKGNCNGIAGSGIQAERCIGRRKVYLGVKRAVPDVADLDTTERLHALAEHGQRAELVDPYGLGAHLWLLQSVGIPLPAGWG